MSDDFASIVNTVNLYAMAVDSHRYAMFEQVFTHDIRCDFGGGAAFTDRAQLMSVFADIHAVFDATQHMTSGHAIKVQGEKAKCLSYVSGRFRRAIEGEHCMFESTGWYDDSLVQTDEGWRIKERTSRMVSYAGDVRVMQAMPGVDTEYDLVSLYGEAQGGRVRFFE